MGKENRGQHGFSEKWQTTLPGAAGGEANTASNIGTAGVGVFDSKSGVDLRFKNVNAGSAKITVTDDTVNDEIDIDVDEAQLTLSNMGGTVGIANGGTGQTAQTAAFDALAPTTTKGDIIVHNGTDNIRLAVGTNDQVLTADSAETSGLKWAASGGGAGGPTTKVTTASQNTTSTSLVDITSLTGFAVSANTSYVFQATIFWTSAGSTTGIGLGVNTPASPTEVRIGAVWQTNTTTAFVNAGSGDDTAITSTAGNTSARWTFFSGTLRNGANAGNIDFRYASENGNQVDVLASSNAMVWEV